MNDNSQQVTARLRVPEHIRRLLKRQDKTAQAVRELYELFLHDMRPKKSLNHCIVFEIAQITYAIEQDRMMGEAVLKAAMQRVIEQCLKDTPTRDSEAHARYILSGAKADAADWARSKVAQKRINAKLRDAGYDQQWILSQAYILAADTLERLERTIGFKEERRRRLLNQIGPLEVVLERLNEQTGRLIEGKAS